MMFCFASGGWRTWRKRNSRGVRRRRGRGDRRGGRRGGWDRDGRDGWLWLEGSMWGRLVSGVVV